MGDELEPIMPRDAARELDRQLNVARPFVLPEQAAARPTVLERGLANASVFLSVIMAYLTASTFLRDNSSDPSWLTWYLIKFAPLAIATFVFGYIGRATVPGASGMALSAVTLAIVILAQITPGGAQGLSKTAVLVNRAIDDPSGSKVKPPADDAPELPRSAPQPAGMRAPAPPPPRVIAPSNEKPVEIPATNPVSSSVAQAPPVSVPAQITKADVEAAIEKSTVPPAKPAINPEMLQAADWQADAEMSLIKAKSRVREKERALTDAERALADANIVIATQERLLASAKENIERIKKSKPVNGDVLRKRFEEHLQDAQRELLVGKKDQAAAKLAVERGKNEVKLAELAVLTPQRAYDAIVRQAKPPAENAAEAAVERPKQKRTTLKLRDGKTIEAVKVVDFGTAFSIKDINGKFSAVEKVDVLEKIELEVEIDQPDKPPVKPPAAKP